MFLLRLVMLKVRETSESYNFFIILLYYPTEVNNLFTLYQNKSIHSHKHKLSALSVQTVFFPSLVKIYRYWAVAVRSKLWTIDSPIYSCTDSNKIKRRFCRIRHTHPHLTIIFRAFDLS